MTAASLALRTVVPRALARPDRARHTDRIALVCACVVVDAVAAAVAILLLTMPHPAAPDIFMALALHGIALLPLSGLARERPSHRWLCVSAMLAVPCVGVAVAATALLTRGRGTVARAHRRVAVRRAGLTPAAIRRLGNALSPCDALESGDDEQRRAALMGLARRDDPEAIVLLRRAASGRDHDLALSAALVLDEIGERAEQRVERMDRDEVRRVAG
jgi:hypothetical protein